MSTKKGDGGRPVRKSQLLLVFVSLLAQGVLAKGKIEVSKFDLKATVTEVTSHEETNSLESVSSKPTFCNDPKGSFEKGACSATSSSTSVSTIRRYILATDIGDKTYDLEGPRLELGEYNARFADKTSHGISEIEFLINDKSGKPKVIRYKIVGERLQTGR